MITMQVINIEMEKVNIAYTQLFENKIKKSLFLSIKQYSSLFGKIFQFFQTGTVEQCNHKKQLLLKCFKKYLGNLIRNTIAVKILKCQHQQQFLHVLAQQWQNFKRFIFYYYALLQNANDHYQQAYKIYELRGQSLTLVKQNSIFPIPAIALSKFRQQILLKNCDKIRKIALHWIQLIRQNKSIDSQSLKILFEIIWSCGLSQLARIKSQNNNIIFFTQQKQQYLKRFPNLTQKFFKEFILDTIIKQTKQYYLQMYQTKIRPLSAMEDLIAVVKYIESQKQFSNTYFITNYQRQQYCKIIYKIVNQKDIQQRINRQNGIKFLLENFKSTSDDFLHEIKLFFNLLTVNKQITLPILQKIIQGYILENGNRLNKKIHKHRQYIQDMIQLKKVAHILTQQIIQKDIRVCLIRDKAFKKILDSLESSKNLAEYIDFTIKQCIKLKNNQQQWLDKFKNIFMILENLGAQDSLLIYHQDFLCKRLIDSLNQPKLQIQTLFLKKLSQKLGTVPLSLHMSMIKDIENSFETNRKYTQKIQSRFNWNIKIFNPTFWPDIITKTKFEIQAPNYIYKQCETIQILYKQQNETRRLVWKLDKGVSLIEGRYTKAKYRFQAENIYIMILLHICDQPQTRILYGNLKLKFKFIPGKDSKQTIQQLFQKYILVLIQNKLINREKSLYDSLHQGEMLEINKNYQPQTPIKPNQIILIRPSPEMQKSFYQGNLEKAKIMKQREKLIEAALVKVMKHSHSSGNNCITFSQLFNAIKTHNYLKMFQFSQSTVKQRLEELIALGYCQRDQQDRKIFHYIA